MDVVTAHQLPEEGDEAQGGEDDAAGLREAEELEVDELDDLLRGGGEEGAEDLGAAPIERVATESRRFAPLFRRLRTATA